MRIEHSIEIERDVREVFDYLANLDNFHQWVDTLETTEVLSGSGSEQGTKFRQVFQDGEGQREVHGEVLRCEAPEVFTLSIRAEGLKGTVEYRCSDAGGRTLLSQVSEMRLSGLLPRLLSPVIRRGSYRQLLRFHDNFKRVLEERGDAG